MAKKTGKMGNQREFFLLEIKNFLRFFWYREGATESGKFPWKMTWQVLRTTGVLASVLFTSSKLQPSNTVTEAPLVASEPRNFEVEVAAPVPNYSAASMTSGTVVVFSDPGDRFPLVAPDLVQIKFYLSRKS